MQYVPNNAHILDGLERRLDKVQQARYGHGHGHRQHAQDCADRLFVVCGRRLCISGAAHIVGERAKEVHDAERDTHVVLHLGIAPLVLGGLHLEGVHLLKSPKGLIASLCAGPRHSAACAAAYLHEMDLDRAAAGVYVVGSLGGGSARRR